jgi:hypothetical protein
MAEVSQSAISIESASSPIAVHEGNRPYKGWLSISRIDIRENATDATAFFSCLLKIS